MNYFKSCLTAFLIIAASVSMKAQTADEVISKYVDAIGGKAALSKINSVYAEYSLAVMGNESTSSSVVLNGKGFKSVSDAMGQKIINCVTDKGGWMINPMSGNSEAIDLPADQYNSSKASIYIDPLSDYSTKGYTVELAGKEMVDNVNAFKIKVTSKEGSISHYFIDPSTYYLLKITNTVDMMGQQTTVSTSLSDYRKSEQGMTMPYVMSVDYGGQFSLTLTTKKVEFNKAIDPVIFEKGNMNL
jgi:hypothetical protein